MRMIVPTETVGTTETVGRFARIVESNKAFGSHLTSPDLLLSTMAGFVLTGGQRIEVNVVEVPFSGVPSGPGTWKSFVTASRALQQRGGYTGFAKHIRVLEKQGTCTADGGGLLGQGQGCVQPR